MCQTCSFVTFVTNSLTEFFTSVLRTTLLCKKPFAGFFESSSRRKPPLNSLDEFRVQLVSRKLATGFARILQILSTSYCPAPQDCFSSKRIKDGTNQQIRKHFALLTLLKELRSANCVCAKLCTFVTTEGTCSFTSFLSVS